MSAEANGSTSNGHDAPLDAVIVGAGFAGMYMLHRLRGMGFAARVFEAGSGVGGTWYWNRYPGARCDVESVQYSYQFSDALQQEWEWSERYAAQPELLRYANHVADRFDLRRDIQFNTRVNVGGVRRGGRPLGDRDRATARAPRPRFCIMATGCLSSPNLPKFEGLDDVQGRALSHRLLAARGGRFHRQARRRHRHRLLGRAVDPDHRRAGQAPHRVPAHAPTTPCRPTTRRSTPSTCAAVKADYPGHARARQADHDRHRLRLQRPAGAGDARPRSASASTSGAGSAAGCGSSAPSRT